MGKHSAGGPFSRKHQHLGHSPGKRSRPLRTIGSHPQSAGISSSERIDGPRGRRTGALEAAPARLKAEREIRRKRYRRVARGIAIGVLLAVVAAAIGVFAYAKKIESTMRAPVVKTKQLDAELKKAKPQEPYNILLLGGDDKPGKPKHRTDTMIVARIDPKTRHVWMLSIPRDTRVEIPGYGVGKINSAYFYGGASLAIKTVSQFTGVPINHYMEVDFRGFRKAVDAMGGIWVDVPVEINDKKAASQTRNKDVSHIDAGYQLLDGDHALVFVRSRKFADADFSRMKHQQIFFKALADQIASRENIAGLPRVVSAVAPYIATDMSLMEMIRTALALKGAGSKGIDTATVVGEWRSPYVWPDEEKMNTLVERMMAEQPFDDTPKTQGSTGGTNTGGTNVSTEPKKTEPKDVTVVVRNGAGIPGCAKQVASIMRARSFTVGEVGNAGQFVYEETLVVYKDNQEAAQMVADALPPGTKLVESRGMYSFKGDVLVVIGKDWDLSKLPVAPIRDN